MVYDIIPQSFTWDDLRDTLNAHGGSVVNADGASAFDGRSNANMWSRYKPVVHAKKGILDDDNFKSVQRGISMPNFDFNYYTERQMSYNKPDGSLYQPFRISDYCRYNPNAVPFIGFFFPPSFYKGDVVSFEIMFNETLGNGFERESMCMLEDVLPQWAINEDYYFTLLLNNDSLNRKSFISDSVTVRERINSGTNSIGFTLKSSFTNYFNVGETLKAIFCIANSYAPDGQNNPISFANGLSIAPQNGDDRQNVSVVSKPIPILYNIEITGTVERAGYLTWDIVSLVVKIEANQYASGRLLHITGEMPGDEDPGRHLLVSYNLPTMTIGEVKTLTFNRYDIQHRFVAGDESARFIEVMVLDENEINTYGSGMIDVPEY